MRFQDDGSDVQKAVTTLQERRNLLQARLNAWFKVQAVYIPVAQTLREGQHSEATGASGHVEADEELRDMGRLSTDTDTEKVKLYLPSGLPPSLRSTGCTPGLREIELKMRMAQISDALEQLKQQLCVYSSFVHYKITQVSGLGQKANTRARCLLLRLREKVMRCADRYRTSRAALDALDPTGDWRGQFRPLLASDLKGPNGTSPDDDVILAMSKCSKRTGEGLRELSWIWRVRCKLPRSSTEELAGAEGNGLTSEADLDCCESF